jgi:hypothetical protein
MAPDPRTVLVSSGDSLMASKEINSTGTASTNDTEIHQSSKGHRGGTTFSTHGLRQDNYRPVDTYEGIHRYDPEFEWEPEEERKIVRKV